VQATAGAYITTGIDRCLAVSKSLWADTPGGTEGVAAQPASPGTTLKKARTANVKRGARWLPETVTCMTSLYLREVQRASEVSSQVRGGGGNPLGEAAPGGRENGECASTRAVHSESARPPGPCVLGRSFMTSTAQFAAAIGIWLGTVTLAGCGDCSSEKEVAQQFLDDPANRECRSNDDCVVVSTGCSGIGYCGQAQLSREASASDQWKNISDDLSGCDNNCDVCNALLIENCTADGHCAQNK
jgi:hypothetical protein